MKPALPAIALGISLACASHAASSQTITVTQQGSGNTAAAEHVNALSDTEGFVFPTTASITQIGNDNHVGGPGATSSGIFQIVDTAHGGARAEVSQTGTGNNAGITQNGRPSVVPPPVDARITQRGTGNDALIRQADVTSSHVVVDQNGSANVARVEHTDSSDASLDITQNGTGNTTTVTLSNSSHGGPEVIQTGDGNTVSLVADTLLGNSATFTQNGSMNSARGRMLSAFGRLSISQLGADNIADVSQTGDGQYADIKQIGNNNLAGVVQAGASNNAVIAQIGNSNSATIGQYGQDYAASVNQTGSGNWTNIYQH